MFFAVDIAVAPLRSRLGIRHILRTVRMVSRKVCGDSSWPLQKEGYCTAGVRKEVVLQNKAAERCCVPETFKLVAF